MYLYGALRAKLDKSCIYNLENEMIIRELLPILYQFLPDDESRKKLKQEMLKKLGGVTLTQIRKTTMEQILPQLKANLLKDWNETDLYN